jgi:hypothetical protein
MAGCGSLQTAPSPPDQRSTAANQGALDANDGVASCELQRRIYWSLYELMALIGIIV